MDSIYVQDVLFCLGSSLSSQIINVPSDSTSKLNKGNGYVTCGPRQLTLFTQNGQAMTDLRGNLISSDNYNFLTLQNFTLGVFATNAV